MGRPGETEENHDRRQLRQVFELGTSQMRERRH